MERPMRIVFAAVCLVAACLASGASAAEPYAPMAPFAALDGKAYRAEWSDDGKKNTVDTAVYEIILDGRALQSTHRIEGSTYGGRTIFFWDETAKKYVYHYFTTGGFHTAGSADMADGVMTSVEAVNGHETIASVKSRASFRPDAIRVEVVYVGKDGKETPTPARVYKPVPDPGPLFPK